MTNPHDSAFPEGIPNGHIFGGLTKREYFAAKAMQGMLANNIILKPYRMPGNDGAENFGEYAVSFADQLIKALNEKSES